MVKGESEMRLVIFCAICAVAISVGLFALGRSSAGRAVNLQSSNIETVGVPEHGLILVGPKDPQFHKLMEEYLEKMPGADMRTVTQFSVFVVNNAAQAVAACNVKWKLQQPDGRVVTHSKAHTNSTLSTVSDSGSTRLAAAIDPNGSLLFSLIHSTRNPGVQFRTGNLQSIAQQRWE